jgi:hypothetical protein
MNVVKLVRAAMTATATATTTTTMAATAMTAAIVLTFFEL